jgi:hypothetical protein
MKRLLLSLVMAMSLGAAPVYFSPSGKTFHTSRECASLKRSKKVLTADEKEAEAHGLHAHKNCGHASASASNVGLGQRRRSRVSAALFIGVFPTGVGYADTRVEEYGDYKVVAFLSFSTLELEIRAPKSDLLPRIKADAASIQARRGQEFIVSGCGQTVLLGGR